jgi:MerR family copper efflux transcriptional regulator
MNIGTVAERCGIPAKTIRYYEDIQLIRPAERRENGYRTYSVVDTRELTFIQRARSLGFSVEEVRELLNLWRDRARPSAAVKAVAKRHLDTLEQKIEELEAMRRTIAHLVEHCRGDSRPDCPILDTLEEGAKSSSGNRAISSTTGAKARPRSRSPTGRLAR